MLRYLFPLRYPWSVASLRRIVVVDRMWVGPVCAVPLGCGSDRCVLCVRAVYTVYCIYWVVVFAKYLRCLFFCCWSCVGVSPEKKTPLT